MAPAVLLLLCTLDAGLTASFPPTPLPKALEILSVASGQRLEATTALKDEVLVARLNNAPRERVLALICQTLNAKWDKGADGTLRLTPDPILLARHVQEKQNAAVTVVQGSLDYLARRLVQQPADLESRTAEAALRQAKRDKDAPMFGPEESPAWRAAARVDDAAAWTARSSDFWPFVSWMGDYLRVLFSGKGPFSAARTLGDSEALRLWSSLGESSRQALRRGETMNLARLTPAAKVAVEKWVYWFEGLGNLEPTEALPRGIHDGSLSLDITEKPVLIGWSNEEGEPIDPMPLDAATFGRALASGSTWWELPGDHFRRFSNFRVGVHRTYSLNFLLEPGALSMKVELSETYFDPSTGSVQKLSPGLAAEIEKARLAALANPPIQKPGKVIPP